MSGEKNSADKAQVGADALGGFTQRDSSSAKSGNADNFVAAIEAAAKNATPATLISQRDFEIRKAAIFQLFVAKSQSEKEAVEATLIVYFAVHGTSPATSWTEYEHNIEALGRTVRPYSVVKIIGQSAIKKFMGRYSQWAVTAYSSSTHFQDAMSERVARAGLDRADGYLAIDYVGKDGSLDLPSMQKRIKAKSHLLYGRNYQRAVDDSRTAQGYAHAREISGNNGTGADPFS